MSSTTSSSTNVVDQSLSPKQDKRVATDPIIQSHFHTATTQANLAANETRADDQPITQLRDLATTEETQLSHGLEETRMSPLQNSTSLPGARTLIPEEELENYFSASLTHPPTEASSPIHYHLALIE